MSKSSPRCAPRVGRTLFAALLLAVAACFQFASAGLDEGAFDLSQSPLAPPEAWAWSPDSTSDGDGVMFVAYLSTFQHAGLANPSVTTTASYRLGVGHQTLQGFISWVVANNANVLSSADLMIVKHVVTTVTLP